jgi:hypothetical protein
VELDYKLGAHAKITASATNSPEEVRVLVIISSQDGAIGGDDGGLNNKLVRTIGQSRNSSPE